MLLIILSWFYISFIFFSIGLGVDAIMRRVVKNSAVPHVVMVLLQGMVANTVLASLLSFVMPLSAIANLLVLLVALACFALCRKRAAVIWARCRNDIGFTPRLLIIMFAVFVFVVACLAVTPPSHYDEGLYYGTTIRWIEEYGVVKGLANVNPRIGFNSSWLLLQALFSFHYLNAGHFIELNGLLLLYVIMYSLGGLNRLFNRDYRIATIVRAFLLVPLVAFHFGASSDFILFNINFLSSPTADLPVCMLLWLVFTWLIQLDEQAEQEYDQLVFNIVLISSFLFIVKPSAAPILLTGIVFFVVYIFKKRWLMAGVLCAIALVVIAPWIGRNILISGYLIFPFPEIDIIHADWKIPIYYAKWHENAVRVYSIDTEYDLGKPFTAPVSAWFPAWFSKLSFIQSLVFIFSSISVVTFLMVFIVNFLKKGRRFISANKYFIFSVALAFGCSVFWFIKGPDFRFGYGFMGMLILPLLALMLQYFLDRDIKFAGFALTAFFMYILAFYYRDTLKKGIHSLTKAIPERRMPGTMNEVKMSNGIIMHLVQGQDSWYAPLPVANEDEYNPIRPVLRGPAIKNGFRSSQ